MIKVIKSFLKKEEAENIEQKFTSNEFPWFITKGIVNEGKDNDYQFNHIFYNNFRINSSLFNVLQPILNVLKPTSIIRIKANLVPKDSKITKHKIHTDVDSTVKNCKVAVYYVNTNNGCTMFKNNKKIISEKNKLVIFDGNTEHQSTTCTDKDYRIVINFNYFE